jgi:hypothetical protein
MSLGCTRNGGDFGREWRGGRGEWREEKFVQAFAEK